MSTTTTDGTTNNQATSLISKLWSWLSSSSDSGDATTNWIKVGERSLLIFLLANFILNTFKKKSGNDQSLFKSITMSLVNSKMGQKLIGSEIEKEVKKNVSQMFKSKPSQQLVVFPEKASPQNEIEQYLQSLKEMDAKTKEGKTFAFVYHVSEGHDEFVTRMHNMFINTNCLSPMAFQSLRQMEIELVEMTSDLFHGHDECKENETISTIAQHPFHRDFLHKEVVGSVSTGGTESLLLMLKAYRDFFTNYHEEYKQVMCEKYPDKSNEIRNFQGPFEVIVCTSVHPAVNKGAHYFGLKLVEVEVDGTTFTMHPEAVEKAFNPGKTILVISSCPSYPHGILDPIEKLSELCVKLGPIGLHVDSCIGGYVMPFINEAVSEEGEKLPPFDFRLLGVTSISADLHKYGYSCKGASVIMYRNPMIRKQQFFAYGEWSGGLYISPTIMGSKGGGPIASSYASLKLLGREGFVKVTREMLNTRKYIQLAIQTDDVLSKYLQVIGNPCSTIIAFSTRNTLATYNGNSTEKHESMNIFSISDRMEKEYGWDLQRQTKPDSLHMTIMPQHIGLEEKIIENLKESVLFVLDHSRDFEGKDSVAMYGMVANVKNMLSGNVVEMFLKTFLDEVYRIRYN